MVRNAARKLGRKQPQVTTAALLKAATSLFVARGYEGASIGQLAKRARVTSGAIYHHYRDKRALFAAVAEAITVRLVEQASQAIGRELEPWEKLCAGIDALLLSAAAPEVRLAFLEAPIVLGLDAWRAIELRATSPLLSNVLETLVSSGQLEPERAPLFARALRGLLVEGAMAVAESKAPEHDRVHLSAMIRAMVLSLRSPTQPR